MRLRYLALAAACAVIGGGLSAGAALAANDGLTKVTGTYEVIHGDVHRGFYGSQTVAILRSGSRTYRLNGAPTLRSGTKVEVTGHESEGTLAVTGTTQVAPAPR